MPQLAGAIAAGLATKITIAAATFTVGQVLMAAYTIGTAIEGRRKARAQMRAAQAAYEASLTDRSVMVRSAVAPRTLVYGQDRVSGPLVDAFTTGDKSQYMHLLVALAGRAVDSIPTVYLNEFAIPAADIDANGFVTLPQWQRAIPHTVTETQTSSGAGVVTLTTAAAQVVVVERATGDGTWDSPTYTHTPGSATVGGLTPATSHRITYSYKTFAPLVRIHKFLGDHTSVPAGLLSETNGRRTAAHVGRSVAWLWVRIEWDQDVFGQMGLPNVSALVRGHRLWDPRSSTTVWSDNAALCAADYARDAAQGLGCTAAQVPDAELVAQANICDELVTLNAGGTTQKRYTANGTLSAADGRLQCMDALLQSMAGQAVWAQGRWVIRAGAHPMPEPITITVDHLADAAPRVQKAASRRDLVNSISATYREPTANYTETQAPPVTSAAYVAQDGGRKVSQTVQLSMVHDSMRAQRLAKIMLERQRQGVTLEIETNLRAYDLLPGQVVPVTIARYGWTNKLFEVRRREFAIANGTVRYALRETAAAVWDWNYGQATVVDLSPDTDLPSPFEPPDALADLAAASGTAHLLRQSDGTILSRVLLTWTETPNAFVRNGGRIEVRWRATSSGPWQAAAPEPGNATSAYVAPVTDGVVLVLQARAVTSGGRAGDWASVVHTVVGKTAPPSAVLGATGTVSKGVATWRVTPPPDADYAHTELRLADTGWGTQSPAPVARFVAPAVQEALSSAGTYARFFRHVDSTGNVSTASVSASVTVAEADLGGGIQTYLQEAEPSTGVVGTLWVQPSSGLTRRYNGMTWDVTGTRNVVSYGSTAPSSPADGDMWGDTSTTPPTWRVRIGGAWQLAANLTTNTNQLADGAGLGQTAVWTGIAARPRAYRVVSVGVNAAMAGASPAAAGVYNSESGALLQDGQVRSYLMYRILRSTGLVDYAQSYDVFGNGASTSGRNASSLADDLNLSTSAHIVVVYCYDEPQTNRLAGGLPAAMYRCGASDVVFGSQRFRFRAAYILVGIPGSGPGNGFEAYQGAADNDPNAWCDVSFQVQHGQLLIGGTAYTPTSLQDYGYTGTLDATTNRVTYAATAPASPVDGDLWVDTSVSPSVVRLRTAGAWQAGANLTTNTAQLTDGAGLGQTAVWGSVASKPADSALLNSYVAPGQNLLPNSDQAAAQTWTAYPQPVGATFAVPLTYSALAFPSTPQYVLQGGTSRSLVVNQNGAVPGGGGVHVLDVCLHGTFSRADAIPVEAGKRYCASVFSHSHRCSTDIGIAWYTDADGFISADAGPLTSMPETSTDKLSLFTREKVILAAPANASHARVFARKYNTASGGDSWAWWTRPQFEVIGADATGPGPYQPGPPANTRQLGYSGALDATKGATFGSDVSGVPPGLPPVFFSGSSISPATISRGFTLASDGVISFLNGTSAREFRWHLGGAPGAVYSAQVDMVSGPSPSTGSVGAQVALSTSRSWIWTQDSVGSSEIESVVTIFNSSGVAIGGGVFNGRLSMIAPV